MPRLFLLTLALLAAGAGTLVAQVPDTLEVEPLGAARDRVEQAVRPFSPRGAFIRSLIIPGWGQAGFEAYTRGGIYFAGWAGNWYMNFRTITRLNEARNRLDLRTGQIRDSLIASAPDPDSMRAVLDTTNILQTAVGEDPIGADLRGLVSSREQQREDWIAWSLFWILISGIDAYVTAHLADFPAGFDVEANADRSVSLRVDVPFPRRRP